MPGTAFAPSLALVVAFLFAPPLAAAHPGDGDQPLVEKSALIVEILISADDLDDGSNFVAEIGAFIEIDWGPSHGTELFPVLPVNVNTSDPGSQSIPIGHYSEHDECSPAEAITVRYKVFESDQGVDPLAKALIVIGASALGHAVTPGVGGVIGGALAEATVTFTESVIDDIADALGGTTSPTLALEDYDTVEDLFFNPQGNSPLCDNYIPPNYMPPPPPTPPTADPPPPPSYEVGPADDDFRRVRKPRYEVIELSAATAEQSRDYEARGVFGVDQWHPMGRSGAHLWHRFGLLLDQVDQLDLLFPEPGADIARTQADVDALSMEIREFVMVVAYAIAAQEWVEATYHLGSSGIIEEATALMDRAAMVADSGGFIDAALIYVEAAELLMRQLHPSFNPTTPAHCAPGDYGSMEGDCNGNGILDSTEIAEGTEVDSDLDGIPDSCQAGPAVWAHASELPQDSFPQSGGIDVSTESARDALDVRIDMARDLAFGDGSLVVGDSVVINVVDVTSGQMISDPSTQIRMHYSLNMNPVFESGIRENAPVTDAAVGLFGWDQHEGVLFAQQSTTAAGDSIPGRYFFDLPDADFMYPGDVLEYYFEAEDDLGRTATLPTALDGYDDSGSSYDARYRMRALPTVTDASGAHPTLLLITQGVDRDAAATEIHALGELGLYEQVQFDHYAVRDAGQFRGNGIGSTGAHGASDVQLAGYASILLDTSDVPAGVLSDGSGFGPNDDSPDIDRLRNWYLASADRSLITFGDHLFSSLSESGGAGLALAQDMGVQLLSNDIATMTGDALHSSWQLTAEAGPAGFGSVGDFASLVLCLSGTNLDYSIPRSEAIRTGDPSAVAFYEFQDFGGGGTPQAGIAMDDLGTPRHRSVAFPMSLASVVGMARAVNQSTRSNLLADALIWSGGHPANAGVAVASPTPPRYRLGPARPNPFNPSTSIAFEIGAPGQVRIRVFDIAGRLVATLLDEHRDAGRHQVTWDGRDDNGRAVSSGVYLYSMESAEFEESRRMTLVK